MAGIYYYDINVSHISVRKYGYAPVMQEVNWEKSFERALNKNKVVIYLFSQIPSALYI